MESFHRRQILGLGLGAMVPSAHAAFGSPLAFQIFSVRAQAAKDFPGTLRQVRDFDYRAVELVSFPGYSGSDARNGFGPLATLAPATVAKIIRDAGLSVAASHFKLEEFHDDRPIEWAKAIGLKYMTISDVPVAADMDAWKKIFERLNLCAERVR